MERSLSMGDVFDTIRMKGTVVIGEDEMDEAPILYIGGNIGTIQTLVLRAKSGTVRFVDGRHSLVKKPNLVIK